MERKKITKTALLYLFVAVFVAVLSFFSVTLAWYIKTQKQNIGINFANPVVVNIDYANGDSLITSITGGNADSVLPGSRISVNVGVGLGANSSPAYVRAKLVITCDVDNDGVKEIFDNYLKVDGGNVVGNNANLSPSLANTTTWQKVEFTENDKTEVWYVWKDNLTGMAKEVQGGEQPVQFYAGNIIVSGEMDSKFAGRKIRIEFIVEAIQTEGVVNPIYSGVWGMAEED